MQKGLLLLQVVILTMAIQGLDAFLSEIGSAIDSDLLNKIKTYHIDYAYF